MEYNEENYKEVSSEEYKLLKVDEVSRGIVEDIQSIEQSMVNVGNVVNNVTNSFSSIIDSCNKTSLAIKRLDTKLELYLAKVDADVEKFTVQLPMIERLLNRISDRIDKTADLILERNRGSLTKEELQQQSITLEVFKKESDSFNDLILKLMLR